MPRPLSTPGDDPVPIVQEAAWVPGPVWTGVENLAPTGIRSPDRPVVKLIKTKLNFHRIFPVTSGLFSLNFEIVGLHSNRGSFK
jgi:hypothetical protein